LAGWYDQVFGYLIVAICYFLSAGLDLGLAGVVVLSFRKMLSAVQESQGTVAVDRGRGCKQVEVGATMRLAHDHLTDSQ